MTSSRRAFLLGTSAALIAAPSWLRASTMPTPRATEGPFYPTALPLDSDNDLVSVTGQQAKARGTIAHVSGRVLDSAGKPVANARVEIWQCDWQGIYLHPRDGGQNRRDTGFQGFGATTTTGDGSYRFRTIKPVAYAGRTPHIHYKVKAGNRELTTQMYVTGEAGNERDGLYRMLGGNASLVTVTLAPALQIEPEAVSGRFDIVLG
ncbi:MAG: pcxB [Alphaproteobacteria bacterium]|jgi:protocatechuate 3,4-dioxygenase beta subunit|nr:pcxB [Alphaproteobacteria bacterium]